jgi:hypothetical protein
MFFDIFSEVINSIRFIFASGAWIFLIPPFAYGIYILYWNFVMIIRYLGEIEWVFLSIAVPKENVTTILAFEQIFAALHGTTQHKTFWEKYAEGQVPLWHSLEIVSLGGNIRFILKTPTHWRPLVEAAIYAQYPTAEIQETEDYLAHLPPPDPVFGARRGLYDFIGTHVILSKGDAYPIRTYKAFEHTGKEPEAGIVDPLATVLEVMSTIQPDELLAVQILIQGALDEWKDEARLLVKRLKGSPVEPHWPWWYKIFIAPFAATGKIIGLAPGTELEEAGRPPSLMLHLTDAEKGVIKAIEDSIAKVGFHTKIRLLYLAPKQTFRGNVPLSFHIRGALSHFNTFDLNGLRFDNRFRTWRDLEYFGPLEAFIDYYRMQYRKRRFMRMFKTRSYKLGAAPFIFNIEELATVFHFPLAQVTAPPMEKVEVIKAEPPTGLPTVNL